MIIKNVSFNFISKVLSFEIDSKELIKEKTEEVKSVISSVEPDAVISEKIILTDSNKVQPILLRHSDTTQHKYK